MKPVLLIDTEHNEVHTLTQARAYLDAVAHAKHWYVRSDRLSLCVGMGYGKNNHRRFSRSKSHVWSSKRPYWHVVDPDTVVLKFGLWDQAEMRHAKDVAKVREVGRAASKAAQAVSWGTTHGRGVRGLSDLRFVGISEPTESEVVGSEFLKRFTEDDWVLTTKTMNVKSEDWKPQGSLTIV